MIAHVCRAQARVQMDSLNSLAVVPTVIACVQTVQIVTKMNLNWHHVRLRQMPSAMIVPHVAIPNTKSPHVLQQVMSCVYHVASVPPRRSSWKKPARPLPTPCVRSVIHVPRGNSPPNSATGSLIRSVGTVRRHVHLSSMKCFRVQAMLISSVPSALCVTKRNISPRLALEPRIPSARSARRTV